MLGIKWTGVDGSTWDLVEGPVRVRLADVEGLGMAPQQAFTKSSPVRHGQRFVGYRSTEREIWLPLHLLGFGAHHSGFADWEALQEAWWRSLRPGEYGRLEITAPSGTVRSIRCRFADDGPYLVPQDPSIRGHEKFGVRLIADEPFWEGPETVLRFQQPVDPTPFLPGFPLHLGPSNVVPTSEPIYLEGTEPLWPVIEIEGPATSFRVEGQSVGGGTLGVIRGAFPIAAGQKLVITTHPEVRTVLLNGVNVWSQLAQREFFQILDPFTLLTMALDGAGSISLRSTPLYQRAY